MQAALDPVIARSATESRHCKERRRRSNPHPPLHRSPSPVIATSASNSRQCKERHRIPSLPAAPPNPVIAGSFSDEAIHTQLSTAAQAPSLPRALTTLVSERNATEPRQSEKHKQTSPTHRPNRALICLTLATTMPHRGAAAPAQYLRLRTSRHKLHRTVRNHQCRCRLTAGKAESLPTAKSNTISALQHLTVRHGNGDRAAPDTGPDKRRTDRPKMLARVVHRENVCGIRASGKRADSRRNEAQPW